MTNRQIVQVCLFLVIGMFAVASTGWCQRPVPIRLAYASPTITNPLILEEQTSTIVESGWKVRVNAAGNLTLRNLKSDHRSGAELKNRKNRRYAG